MFLSNNLEELTSRLMYLQNARGGIGLIIGEAGTGKTTALRKYAQSLNPALFQSFYFPLATVTVQEFYRGGLALELGEEPKHKKVDLFTRFSRRLVPCIMNAGLHRLSF